jgi:hypothetical protein
MNIITKSTSIHHPIDLIIKLINFNCYNYLLNGYSFTIKIYFSFGATLKTKHLRFALTYFLLLSKAKLPKNIPFSKYKYIT